MAESPFVRDGREMGWHRAGGVVVRLPWQHASSLPGSRGAQELAFPSLGAAEAFGNCGEMAAVISSR